MSPPAKEREGEGTPLQRGSSKTNPPLALAPPSRLSERDLIFSLLSLSHSFRSPCLLFNSCCLPCSIPLLPLVPLAFLPMQFLRFAFPSGLPLYTVQTQTRREKSRKLHSNVLVGETALGISTLFSLLGIV